jgi:hypothetical protein
MTPSDCSAAAEDWELLQFFFPTGWADLAQTTNALKGLRQDKSHRAGLARDVSILHFATSGYVHNVKDFVLML